jgi:hypothetical protein
MHACTHTHKHTHRKHVDEWDSVTNKDFPLLDAIKDILGPCRVWHTYTHAYTHTHTQKTR